MLTVKGEVEVAVSSDTERVRKRRLLLASVAKKAGSWAMTEPSEPLLSGNLTNSESYRTTGTTHNYSFYKPRTESESEQWNRAIRGYGAGLSILGWRDTYVLRPLTCLNNLDHINLSARSNNFLISSSHRLKTLPHDSEQNCTYLVTCLTASSTRYRTTCLIIRAKN